MTCARRWTRSAVALAVGALSCGAPSPAPQTRVSLPVVETPAPPDAGTDASPTVAVPSVEDRLDALIADGWRQRSAGDSAGARATFARAKAALPPGAALERAGSFLPIEPLHGEAPVIARGDLLVLHGGSGPNEASVLVDSTTAQVVRWFGRANAVAAGRDHALLLRDVDADKHTGKLTWADLKTGAESAPVVVWADGSSGVHADVVVSPDGQSVSFTAENASTVIHFLKDWSADWSTGPADPDHPDQKDLNETDDVDFSPDGQVAFVVPEILTPRGPQPQRATLTAVDGDTTYSEDMPEPVDPFFPGRIPPAQTDPFHAFSPDSRYVLIEARKKGVLQLVETATGSVLASTRDCYGADFVGFAPDGKHVVLVHTETVSRSRVCSLEVPSLRVAARATWHGEPTWLVPFGARMLTYLVGTGGAAIVLDPATLKTVATERGAVYLAGKQRALVDHACDPKARPSPDCGALFEATPDAIRLVRKYAQGSPPQPELADLPENAADRLCHAGRWVFPAEACSP